MKKTVTCILLLLVSSPTFSFWSFDDLLSITPESVDTSPVTDTQKFFNDLFHELYGNDSIKVSEDKSAPKLESVKIVEATMRMNIDVSWKMLNDGARHPIYLGDIGPKSNATNFVKNELGKGGAKLGNGQTPTAKSDPFIGELADQNVTSPSNYPKYNNERVLLAKTSEAKSIEEYRQQVDEINQATVERINKENELSAKARSSLANNIHDATTNYEQAARKSISNVPGLNSSIEIGEMPERQEIKTATLLNHFSKEHSKPKHNFLNDAAEKHIKMAQEAFKKGDELGAKMHLDLAAELANNAMNADFTPDTFHYEFENINSPEAQNNINLYEKLKSIYPHGYSREQAKELGLAAVIASDKALSESDQEKANIAYEIGMAALDALLGFIPAIGMPKDCYEYFTGISATTGAPIGVTGQIMAGVGLLTMGYGHTAIGVYDAMEKTFEVLKTKGFEKLAEKSKMAWEALKELTKKTKEDKG